MNLGCNPSLKTARDTATALLWWLILAIFVLPLAAQEQEKAPAGEASNPPDSNDTLMLVRQWDSNTGLLTGWLPSHSLAIQLQFLFGRKPKHFEPGQAVYLEFPTEVRVSPPPRVFEGESWLPVKRDANIVRISKGRFLVLHIILNESKWRRSTNPSTAGRPARAWSPP